MLTASEAPIVQKGTEEPSKENPAELLQPLGLARD